MVLRSPSLASLATAANCLEATVQDLVHTRLIGTEVQAQEVRTAVPTQLHCSCALPTCLTIAQCRESIPAVEHSVLPAGLPAADNL